jgi:hypothetical protein
MGILTDEAFAEFLDFDGILFLRLAEVNSGVLATEDVFKRLWKCLSRMSNRNKEKSFAMNSTNSQVAIDAGDSNETDDDNQVCTL